MHTRLLSIAMLTLIAGGTLGFGAAGVAGASLNSNNTDPNDSPFNHGYCVGYQYVQADYLYTADTSSLCDDGNMI